MQTALITGASGFCGRHLIRCLTQTRDMRPIGLDLGAVAPAGVGLSDYFPADLSDPAQTGRVVQQCRPDVVFHLAGISRGSYSEVCRGNILGGVCLLESVRQFAPDARVIIIGSAAEYGIATAAEMPLTEEHPCSPSSAYGLSKYTVTLAAMEHARTFGLKVAVVRPFNIVGAGIPASLVVGAILHRAKEALANNSDPVVSVGNLDTERDFVAVEDVVKACVQLADAGPWGEVFNICSGQPRSIRSVIEGLLSFSPKPIRLVVDPAMVRPADVQVAYGSWEKARRAFGFKPSTSLDDSLRSAWEYAMGGGR